MTFETTTGGTAPAPAAALAPVAVKDRVVTLDVLRGFAVLGILAMNAAAFAWPFDLMMSPDLAPYLNNGILAPADRTAAWVNDVFFSDKMRSLFSMLFGVSIFLVGGERSDRARGALLQRRLLWLGLIGLIHGLVFWFGDILLLYALSGLIMLLCRSWSAKKLLWVGGGITLFFALCQAGGSIGMAALPPDVAAKFGGSGSNPFGATPESIVQSIAVYKDGLFGNFIANAKGWVFSALFALPIMPFATVPLMMIGLGLYKTGFWAGRAPVWIYGLLMALTAVNLSFLGLYEGQELAVPKAENPSRGLADAMGSFAPLVTLGYASALILLSTRGAAIVTRIFAPVGRMAFTNYLTQTLIMTSLFYMPWGPRWFGEVTPAGLWPIVGAIWVLQLVWSPLWLARFEMGPLEWVWRCLTYGRRVPFRKVAVA
ncbi:DUF418 domain-containing protein [Brevundimonas variabilis]|uniref:DUF418 domain-containing protein n=1 Tax=Brevundimonas variabilis TaxID=74312 RepID=A0A7W9FFA1_9CAUL|nr:DUF418 domain-containing protein [Brevundimonas variabilis]MBB5747207.1 uncharacterized protein [Brevundimonas variabilis]